MPELISSIIIIFLIGLGIAILLGKRLASLPLFGIYAGIALYTAYWSLRMAVESRFHFDDLGGAYMSYAVIVIIFSVFFAVINWLVWKTK